MYTCLISVKAVKQISIKVMLRNYEYFASIIEGTLYLVKYATGGEIAINITGLAKKLKHITLRIIFAETC